MRFIGFIVLVRLVSADLSAIVRACCNGSIGLWGYNSRMLNDLEKNRPPDERRPIHLTSRREVARYLEVEPDTRAHQVLSQIASLPGINLGACVVEVVVFDEGAELRRPIVI